MISIWSGFNLVTVYFFSPETFAPIILTQRAKAQRKAGDLNAISEHEIKMSGKSVIQTIRLSAAKVFLLLSLEPILSLLCVW